MNSPQVKRELRSPREIRKMRRAGLVVWQSHQAAFRLLKPGVTTAELNLAYRQTFAEHQATSLFLGYGPEENPFPAETCISVNEELVHGIPSQRELNDGDIVSLDTGCSVEGWCGDAAITVPVGAVNEIAIKLLDVTHRTLNLAIECLSTKQMWSEVAREMQAFVEGHGYSVVKDLTGHGIGKKLHEPPQAPNYWEDDFRPEEDFEIRPGVVIACEPMVHQGVEDIEVLKDEWTTVTADRKLSAHFEHTIAITKDGPVRLTGPPSDEELEWVPKDFHNASDWLDW